MKTTMKLVVLAVLFLAVSTVAYAAASEGSGNAVVNGFGKLIRLPITMLDKASDSMDKGSGGPAVSEDVAVAPVYDLDAETTG